MNPLLTIKQSGAQAVKSITVGGITLTDNSKSQCLSIITETEHCFRGLQFLLTVWVSQMCFETEYPGNVKTVSNYS
jgi:hypothetical protein